MNINKITIGALIAGILTLGISCTSKKEKETAVISRDTVSVRTMMASYDTIRQVIEYTATLVAFEEVHLAPATPGRIKQLNVEIGSRVSKGQVVAEMDCTNLEQSRINLMKLATDFKRLDTLKKTNSISEQQYDMVKTSYEIAKTSYQYLLDNTQLRAPFSGLISGKYFEDGEIYSGSPVSTIGKPAVVSIVQINNLKALVNVSSNFYSRITKGLKVDVTSDIYPELTFIGETYNIYPTLDNATKTFTVEVKVQNENLKLRPGMFAKMRISLGKGKAIMVPTIALIKQTGTANMFVFVNRNNMAVKTSVVTGTIVDDKTEILEGLSEGDEVIVIGQNKLEDQTPIVINK